jgi:centromere/kinetochore protein ZW10
MNAGQLTRHVKFLQLCCSAQKSLNEIDGLSSEKMVVMPFSPSSMLLSPSSNEGRFTFETSRSVVRDAAAIVKRVEEQLEEAMSLSKDLYRNSSGDIDDDDDEAVREEQEKQLQDMQSAIIDELRHQLCRKRMELRHRAISTLEGCLMVEKNKLSIRGVLGNKENTKRVAFDNMTFGDEPKTPREDTTNSPLSDAYAVLETFNNGQYPVFGETLDRAIKTIGEQLFRQVFEPTIRELDLDGKVGYYKFTQKTVKHSNTSKKYDPVVIKGQAVQLSWELKKMDFVPSFTNGESSIIVSTASDISEQDLAASSPLAEVTTFLSCLNLVLRVLEFVHQHVLLQRTDLAKLLGGYLFGSYPISTTLSSGSAILGGFLVGFDAQGEENGEVRPLMVELVKCMRKWCIPNESNLRVWRMITEIQGVLIKEVTSFEDKLIQMGFMNSIKEMHKFSGASSPSGLSVLVNQDEVGSPIDINMTMDNQSPIGVSSPPIEPNKRNKSVRSSMSEIAYAFLQAYSESQRSQILNNGRSILVNTDYHNAVQVGKFVPPTSEKGTLDHLNEDSLNAFAFQQCSISITAQKTLELVRQTLDEAIRPEMARELDALPPMLYRASREVFDLFRAMVPTLYAGEIGTIPRMAAILHNDCVFLAHEASLLGESLDMSVSKNFSCRFC